MKNFIKKRTCRRIFFRTTGAFSINIVSADSTQHDSENQNQHTDRHVDIFADRIIQIREFAASSLVYLGLHILLSADPEEHDSGKAGAERADVDRQNIHPLDTMPWIRRDTTTPITPITPQAATLPR